MKEKITVKFQQWDCVVSLGQYKDKSLAIELYDDEGPVAVATVCIPGTKLAKDEILVKDWSQNQGMFMALLNAGVISGGYCLVPTGYVFAMKCKLTTEFMRKAGIM